MSDEVIKTDIHGNPVEAGVNEGGEIRNQKLGPGGYAFTSDFLLEVAKGNILGHTMINKFGENPDIDTATDPEDMWDAGGTYPFSTSADIDQLSSSDDGDTQEITIIGLDENWEEVTQTKTLTGQTPVTLDTPLIRVYRAWNNGTSDFAGDIYLTTNGAALTLGVPDVASAIRMQVRNGNNQSLMCVYTVPAGKTAFVLTAVAAFTKGARSTREG